MSGKPDNARSSDSNVLTPSFSQVAKRESVSEEVLRQFVDLLRAGQLIPGAKLPTERELATMLGISRPSVREALRALNLLGVTTSTQGRGTYLVESLDRLPLEPYLFHLLLNQSKLLELMEIRKIIEPEVAALAAKRANERARLEMLEKFAEQERIVHSGGDRQTEARVGAEFHQALARATGNTTLSMLLESLSDLINQTGELITSHTPGASLEYHRELMQAVLNRDSRKARRLMKHHLAEVEQQLRSSLQGAQRADGDKE